MLRDRRPRCRRAHGRGRAPLADETARARRVLRGFHPAAARGLPLPAARQAAQRRDPAVLRPVCVSADAGRAGPLSLQRGQRTPHLHQARGAPARDRRRARAWRSPCGRPPPGACRCVGNFNHWDGRYHPMRSLGASGRLGAVRARPGRGRDVQVRNLGPARPHPSEDRSLRDLLRGAAQQRRHRLQHAPAPVERRRLARAAQRAGGAAGPPALHLRGAPRFVAAHGRGRRAAADLPRAGAGCSPTTRARWATRTSRSCRWPSIRSTARGATRSPGSSRRPTATARRRISRGSSTTCTSAASA